VDSYEPIKGDKIVAKTIPSSLRMPVMREWILYRNGAHFSDALRDALNHNLEWPHGFFEEPPFNEGTIGIARSVARPRIAAQTVIVAEAIQLQPYRSRRCRFE
jgi:hypothetical protein